jgi:hypothetical protein
MITVGRPVPPPAAMARATIQPMQVQPRSKSDDDYRAHVGRLPLPGDGGW